MWTGGAGRCFTQLLRRSSLLAAGSRLSRCPHVCSCLAWARRFVAPLGVQSRRDRVAAKFVEAEFEKCDRLMEVYLRYEGRVAAEEAR